MREKIGVGCLMGMLALSASAFTVDPEKTVIVSDHPQDLAVQSVKGCLDAILGADVRVIPVKEAAKLGAETYMWRLEPASARDRAVERYSWDVSPTGAVFRGGVSAVSGYFEDRMGVRYPWGTEVAWHGTRPAEFVADAGDWTPELRLRNMRGKGDGLLWRFRLRDGAHDRPNYGHAFCWYWKRFSKTHPEFFAMRADGKRLPVNCDESVRDRDQKTARPGTKEAKYIDHISMCPSCEGLADQLVADWKAAGAPKYLNACENDSSGQDICTCDACKALDEPKPADAEDWWPNWYADRYVVFTKRVLERARKVRPDVKVVMYAYNATERAPRREKLDKDIIVGMVPTYFSKESYLKYIDDWKAAGMTEFFLRSNRRCYFSAAYTPVGWERHFFDLVRAAIDRGAIGFDFDGGTPKKRCPTAWLCDYVVKKAMTDPSKDFDYWMGHYCESFGAAKVEMGEYFRYWREEVFEKRIAPDFMKISVSGKVFNFTRGLFWKLGDYYRPSDYATTLAILDRALAKRGLAADDRARIAEIRFQTEHASLIYEAVVHKGAAKKPYSKALYGFRKAHGLQIMPHYEDYWGDLTGMREYDKLEKEAAAKGADGRRGFYGPTIRDRLWMWGHHPDSVTGGSCGFDPKGKRVDQAAACKLMGIPNDCVIRWRNLPAHPWGGYFDQFRALKRFSFGIIDSAKGTVWEKLDLAINELKPRFPNMTGCFMDDFFVKKSFTLDEADVAKVAERVHANGLRLSVVLYSDQDGIRPEYRGRLALCDEVSFWFWKGESIPGMVENVRKCRAFIGPDKDLLLGLYMWDFNSKRPITGAQMAEQLGSAERLLADRTVDGLIFHPSFAASLDLDSVRTAKRWIAENGDRPWGERPPTDLYLLAGQSNMAGRGKLTEANRIDLSGVRMLTASNGWVSATEPIHFDKPWCAGAGLGASFAAEMRAADKSRTVGLVPSAMGGTKIEEWRPGGQLFRDAVARMKTAQEVSGGRLRAILWHQGESDCKEELIAAYPKRLRTLVAEFRKALGADVPFVAGELGRRIGNADKFNAMLHRTLGEIPKSACVPSEGLSQDPDRLHFSTQSLRTFGRRYAEAVLKLEAK